MRKLGQKPTNTEGGNPDSPRQHWKTRGNRRTDNTHQGIQRVEEVVETMPLPTKLKPNKKLKYERKKRVKERRGPQGE